MSDVSNAELAAMVRDLANKISAAGERRPAERTRTLQARVDALEAIVQRQEQTLEEASKRPPAGPVTWPSVAQSAIQELRGYPYLIAGTSLLIAALGCATLYLDRHPDLLVEATADPSDG